MRATKAYIASFGTTGVLLASSLALLMAASALVAFKGWPDGGVSERLESVVIDPQEESFRVPDPGATSAGGNSSASGGADGAGSASGGSDAGGASDGEAGGGSDGTGGGGQAPGSQGGGGGEAPPDTGGSAPQSGAPSTPTQGGGNGLNLPQTSPVETGPVTDQLSDTTRQITQDTGQLLNGISPELGQTVTDTGDALSDAVEGLPNVSTGR
jgi:hypothetical protein